MSSTAHDDALRINLLGSLEVIRNGQRNALPASRKTRGLLAYLALAVQPCRREDLCDLLWDNVDDPRAELRWCLSRLRAALGPWLVTSRDSVTIAPERLSVDAIVFRRLATETSSRPDAERALKLWRGRPLADVDVSGAHGFHCWWIAEREILSATHQSLLHRVIELSWPSHDQALVAARHLVSQYPTDEKGHWRVSQALHQLGRQTEARTYLATTRHALSLELGVPPASLMMDLPHVPYVPTPGESPLTRSSGPPPRLSGTPPLLGVSPIRVVATDETLRSMAAHLTSDLAHGLWRSGICDVVEVHDGVSERVRLSNLTYAVRGKIDRIHDGLTLSLRCETTRPTAALWYARYGPDRSHAPPLANWIGNAIGAIQSSVQIAEIKRVQQRNREGDRTLIDAVLEAHSHAALLEPSANHRALTLLDGVLNQTPDDARALALAAWCHAQRGVYNWSVDAADDRRQVERLAASAAQLGSADPICLTMIGTARTLLGDHVAARTLLNRAFELNPEFVMDFVQTWLARGVFG